VTSRGTNRERHVYLVGMPGAGKSTVGRLVAERMHLPFIDMDRRIADDAGASIAELFADRGEEGFRDLEADALANVAAEPPAVVACGGGAVLRPVNRSLLRDTGTVVYLSTSIERLAATGVVDDVERPLVRSPGDLARLLAERDRLYRATADLTIAADGTPDEAVATILSAVGPDGGSGRMVRVEVPGREYTAHVGRGLLHDVGRFLPPGTVRMAFVVADSAVAARFLEPLTAGLASRSIQAVHLSVPPGEDAKSLAVAEALYRQLALREAHRDDLVVALGGGSTGDVAGFVAATYMRGVPLMQLPTTLTGQVDAAIGGKTGVNLPEGKNLVGAFHQPVVVVADVTTLAGLPDRQYRSGLAEVAKVGLALDGDLLTLLEKRADGVLGRDPGAMEEVVFRCLRAKAAVVAADELDHGARLVLNYGHTLGHALEGLDDFSGRTHGEAIAVGMVFAARLAESLGVAAPGLVGRHIRLLGSLGLPTGGPLPAADAILRAIRLDKKHLGGVRFVVLEDVGHPRVVEGVEERAVEQVLDRMGSGGADPTA